MPTTLELTPEQIANYRAHALRRRYRARRNGPVIADYLTLADRMRQELVELARVVNRAERAVRAAREQPEDQDLYAALNPHDF